MKACPFCAEQIQDAAVKCRYCGSDLRAPPPPPRICAGCAEEVEASTPVCPYCGTLEVVDNRGTHDVAAPHSVGISTAPPAVAAVAGGRRGSPGLPSNVAAPAPPPAVAVAAPYWTRNRVIIAGAFSLAVLVVLPISLLGGFGFIAALFSLDGAASSPPQTTYTGKKATTYPAPAPVAAAAPVPVYVPPPPPPPPPEPEPYLIAGQAEVTDCSGLISTCFTAVCPLTNTGDAPGSGTVTFTAYLPNGEQVQAYETTYLIPGQQRGVKHRFEGNVVAGSSVGCSVVTDEDYEIVGD